jgi:MFS family permease
MPEEETKTLWFWAFVPINASTGIFLTLLPLYILNLGGNVVDVGLITSSYLFSLIPAALIWGYAIDHFPYRKRYITFSCFGMGAVLVLSFLFNQLGFLSLFLVLFGFVSAAAAPAVNLLIMESFAKSQWPNMIAEFSYVSLLGNDAGIVIGMLWTSFYDLRSLIGLSALLSLVSGALVLKSVQESKVVFEREAILFSKETFIHRLRSFPIIFIRVPKWQDFRRFARMLRSTFLKEVPLLYFSVFIFNLGTNIYSTSYVPSLKQNYVLDNQIFLITLSNSIAQTLMYFYVQRKGFFERHMAVDATKLILAFRTGMFLITSVVILLFQQTTLMVINLMIYAGLGGCFALYNIAVSFLVFRTLNYQGKGEILGIYSALGGIFSFMGAFASGYLSYNWGYPFTFLISAILMAISIYLVSLSGKIGERTRLLNDIITYG